jgi:hypothetical protein
MHFKNGEIKCISNYTGQHIYTKNDDAEFEKEV